MKNVSERPFDHNNKAVTWHSGNRSVELKNYQTNRSMTVTAPVSIPYQDCRYQMCTSTLMSLPANVHKEKISDSEEYYELQSNSLEYVRKEAYDFLSLYRTAKGVSEECYRRRLDEIDCEIRCTGLYTHTSAELEYGCQLAWRNAARCINRLYWSKLKILDRRNSTTNYEMFLTVCDHLRMTYNQGLLQATILVMNRNARLWSTQYLLFACYEQSDGSLLGDPMNRELTKVAMQLGWNKPPEQRTQWDILPIIVQYHPDVSPSWYELPDNLRPTVFLSHPDPKYAAAIKSLDLRWFAQPFVSDKALEIGGIVYKCAPFSGWFMGTEVGRDLCDTQRYNIIPKLAALLNLDITVAANGQLNIDRIYVEMNAAILHSYQQAKVTMIDHHTAASGFMKFMQQEVGERGNTPADWVWLVPPVSSGMSILFHQEMLNYVVKPRIMDQQNPWIYYQPFQKYQTNVRTASLHRTNYFSNVLRAACKMIGLLRRTQNKQMSVNVLYATMTGTAKSYAEQTRNRLLAEGYYVKLMELDEYPFQQAYAKQSIVIIITSTFGQGNASDGGHTTEEWLKEIMHRFDKDVDTRGFLKDGTDQCTKISLPWCVYAVCAIGSSAYPVFCGFGKLIDRAFEHLAAQRLVPLVTCDALNHQYKTYNEWENSIITTLNEIYPPTCAADIVEVTAAFPSYTYQQSLLLSGHVQNPHSLLARPNYIPLTFDTSIDRTNKTEGIGPFTKDNPFRASVLKNFELVDFPGCSYDCDTKLSDSDAIPKSECHSVRSIVLETTGLSYQPGDHICILPENITDDVNAVILACGWNPRNNLLDKPCSLSILTNKRYTSLREILTCFVDLTALLRPTVLRIFTTYAMDENEQCQLSELAKGLQIYEDWLIDRPTVKDVLDQFRSIKIPIEELIQLLPPLQPRYYSISSSNNYSPNQLHITVSVASYITSKGIVRKGICSHYLQQTISRASQTRKPSVVNLFLSPNPHFRLPGQEKFISNMTIDENSYFPLQSPLLMFAVGSGIAPFRSFWQELQALEELRDSVQVERILFIGVRTPKDLLYKEELEDLVTATDKNKKILTAVIPVYSRMNPNVKRYVQDAMLDYKHMIYAMMTQENSVAYICGSVQSCLGIESTLATIIQLCHPEKPSEMESVDTIRRLEVSGRIKKDMFG